MTDTNLSDPAGSRSLWSHTATPAPSTTRLKGDTATDVLVIGGGFTGLVAALTLAEAGRNVIVLEARDIGWGASGRNNGQVIPGLKLDPRQLESRFGVRRAEALVTWSGDAPRMVFELIRTLKIDCAPVQNGWIQPAYTIAGMRDIEARYTDWSRRGAHVRLLEKSELDKLLGSPAFVGGWLDPRGGSIHPLDYVRGLATAAINRGVKIYTGTEARALKQSEHWSVHTDAGSISARHLIVATGAYTGALVPGLEKSFIPVRTAQVATRPLDPELRQVILPQGHVASDTRRLLTSMRISPDGRLVMGGSGATGGAHARGLERNLHRAAAEMFPDLPSLDWEYGWSGYLSITTDHVPHIHEPAKSLHVALGCNGRGIAICTSMGKMLASRILGASADTLPISISPIRKIPLHRFRNLGISLSTAIKGKRDTLDRQRTMTLLRRSSTRSSA